MKPVQCGGSETGRNWIFRNIDVAPGPTMIVFPTEQSCRENVDERIIPGLKDSPQLRTHITEKAHDLKKGTIHLRSCSIYMGWAGSPQALASRPIRYLLLDEVDKYTAWNGKEADPVNLARARLTTYKHNSKLFVLSTPTTPEGVIARGVKNCPDVREFCIRCPECQELQAPDFARLEWEGRDESEPDDIKEVGRRLGVGEIEPEYVCDRCEARIGPLAWRQAVRAGEWVSVGFPPGEHPLSREVGFRLSGLCAIPGIEGVAREWMKARIGDMGALQYFYTNILGVPFWGDAGGDPNLKVDARQIYDLATEGCRRYQVPDWATSVVMGADTAKVGHQYTIYAVGSGYQMQLLDYGECSGDEILKALDKEWTTPGGKRFKIRRVCVDLGGSNTATSTRTEDVYRLAQREPAHIWPVKGWGGNTAPSQTINTTIHSYTPPGGKRSPFDVKSSVVDVGYFKDLLAQSINQATWHPFQGIGRDFVSQMASEEKRLVETKIKPDKSRVEVWRWLPRSVGVANHYWDCTVYALVAAHMLGAGDVEPEPVTPREIEERSTWDTGRISSSWL